MLSALRAYPGPRGTRPNLRGWLLRIAERKALDAHRAARRRPIPVEEVPERPRAARRASRPGAVAGGAAASGQAAGRGDAAVRRRPGLRRHRESDRVLRGRPRARTCAPAWPRCEGSGCDEHGRVCPQGAGRGADRRGVRRRGLAVRPPDRGRHGRRDRQAGVRGRGARRRAPGAGRPGVAARPRGAGPARRRPPRAGRVLRGSPARVRDAGRLAALARVPPEGPRGVLRDPVRRAC